MRRILVIACACALALVGPELASADPTPCPDVSTADSSPAAAEYASCAAIVSHLDRVDTDVTASSGAPVSGTVALSADDAHRLDLAWWGMWALVGLVLVLLIAPRWFRAFSLEDGKGV